MHKSTDLTAMFHFKVRGEILLFCWLLIFLLELEWCEDEFLAQTHSLVTLNDMIR